MPQPPRTARTPKADARGSMAPALPVMPTKRAVIYLRVSTAGQANTSLEGDAYSIAAQREACHRKAEALDALVLDEYIDAGESARSSDRPQLQAMLQRLIGERDIDYVIVHKVDRLARNRSDDVTINLMITKAGAQLVSVSEAIDDTPSGMLLHGIMSSIAEFYSQNLATEIKKGMHQKAKSGVYPGMAPIGYLNVRLNRDGHEVRTIAVDPDRAHLITWAFEAYASGEYSLNQLTEELAAKGLRTRPTPKRPAKALPVTAIHKLLKRRVYIGMVTWAGEEHMGSHEPLISVETFATVQAIMASRSQSEERQRAHPHHLKGDLYCGRCGAKLSFTKAKGRHGGIYDYFYCLGRVTKRTICDLPYLPARRVEELVIERYEALQINSVTAKRLKDELLQGMRARTKDIEKLSRQERKRIQTLENDRRKLLQAHLAGAVPLDLLKEEQDRITAELANAGGALAATEIKWEQIEENLGHALGLVTSLSDAYGRGTPQVRRRLNQSLFSKITIDKDRAEVELQPAFAYLLAEDLLQDALADTANPDAVVRRRGSNTTHMVDQTRLYSNKRSMGSNKNYMVELIGLYSNRQTFAFLEGSEGLLA